MATGVRVTRRHGSRPHESEVLKSAGLKTSLNANPIEPVEINRPLIATSHVQSTKNMGSTKKLNLQGDLVARDAGIKSLEPWFRGFACQWRITGSNR